MTRDSGGPGPRPHLAKGEQYYHGRNSCLALLRQRPGDIIRVYVRKDLARDFSPLLDYCSANRKSYHLVSEGELEKITDTKHHDGICVLAREKRLLREQDLFREVGGGRNLILYLDGVGNPHNLGAILRSAAHFGQKFLAIPAEDLPRIPSSAHRISEGGSEFITPVKVEDPEKFMDRLKGMGFQIYVLDPGEKSIPLYDSRLAEKAVFILGAEVEGVSGLMRALADATIRIPGTGTVESLNVSVAAALAMAEFHRQSAQRSVRIVKQNPVR